MSRSEDVTPVRSPRDLVEPLPRKFGPFTLVERLGSGGSGTVYRAEGSRISRPLAVKVLNERQDTIRPSLLAEVSALAQLHHTNIPSLLAWVDDGHQCGIAMDLFPAGSLAEYIRAHGSLPLDLALDIAIQIVHALAAVHALGIVHADLKPSNVMLREDGSIALIDFGLARDIGGENAALAGTPAYMSPEQTRGEAMDGRSDFFSLGATLYELLSGRRLFARPTFVETAAAVCAAEIPLTPARDLLACMMARDRSQRPQSAASLQDTLLSQRWGWSEWPRVGVAERDTARELLYEPQHPAVTAKEKILGAQVQFRKRLTRYSLQRTIADSPTPVPAHQPADIEIACPACATIGGLDVQFCRDSFDEHGEYTGTSYTLNSFECRACGIGLDCDELKTIDIEFPRLWLPWERRAAQQDDD